MKMSEAVQHLREMLWALQKYRSITMETLGPGTGDLYLSEEFAAEMWPWVFGEKCPLPALSKILDDVDSGNDLVPHDYYNMMTILERFMPEVKLAAVAIRGGATIPEGPPNVNILAGWDEE